MHDLHLADKIIKKILEFAKTNNLKKVKTAYIKIGDILEHGEMIAPSNLKFNLKLLSTNTLAQNADFKVEKFDKTGEYEIVEIEGE